MAHIATVHNPSNFEPRDYDVLDYLDNRRPEYCGETVEMFAAVVAQWKANMVQTFGPDYARKIHSCAHCGNGNVRWITAVKHIPTGDVVAFGSDCTDRLGFANKVSFKLAQVMARAEARKVRFTIYTKRAAFLTANPAIADALAAIGNPIHARNTFAQDVLNKLDQYGTLSTAQINAVLASMKRDEAYAVTKAADTLEVKGDAPSGRVTVTGTVLSVKTVDSVYGVSVKMLVKLTNNAKVWLTVPSKSDIQRDDVVTVTATFTVSNDDKSFAFGKRPTLVSSTRPVAA